MFVGVGHKAAVPGAPPEPAHTANITVKVNGMAISVPEGQNSTKRFVMFLSQARQYWTHAKPRANKCRRCVTIPCSNLLDCADYVLSNRFCVRCFCFVIDGCVGLLLLLLWSFPPFRSYDSPFCCFLSLFVFVFSFFFRVCRLCTGHAPSRPDVPESAQQTHRGLCNGCL